MEYPRLWKQVFCFIFFIGIIFTVGCKNDDSVENGNIDRKEKKNRVRKNRDVNEDKNLGNEDKNLGNIDVNVELNLNQKGSDVKDKDSLRNVILVLNTNVNSVAGYKLWQCKKDKKLISYFLNNTPNTIDDEGTSQARKRVCELFKIEKNKNGKVEAEVNYLAHHTKNWCEQNLQQILILQSQDDFQCNKVEDLSFIFDRTEKKDKVRKNGVGEKSAENGVGEKSAENGVGEKSAENEVGEKSAESEDNNSDVKDEDSLRNVILGLNTNVNNVTGYELWQCKKEEELISYFLNNAPNTIDDKGTSNARKRLCELFTIEKNKNDGEFEATTPRFWAHQTKNFCEQKLLDLIMRKSNNGFQCDKAEDISFIFYEN